jgi:hypothetical protein
MKKIFAAFLLAFALQATAQQSETISDANVETRTLSETFSAIWVSDGIDLFLTQGDSQALAISASEERYKMRLKTEVINGTLKIYYDSKDLVWNSNSKRKLKVYVSFISLTKLSADAGANVMAKNILKLGNLEMKCSSGATVFAEVEATAVDASQNSGAEIVLKGKVGQLQVEVNSGAMFKGFDLAADNCSAKASSGGGVRILVNKELNAHANSGGGIQYKGEAVIKNLNVNSGGYVKRANQ